MKILLALAAACAAWTATPAAAAAASQDRIVVRETVRPNGTRVTVRERTTTTIRRGGYDRPRYRYRTVCRTRYDRDGDRRRVCRRVRYRR
jgi:hypothetical protein